MKKRKIKVEELNLNAILINLGKVVKKNTPNGVEIVDENKRRFFRKESSYISR